MEVYDTTAKGFNGVCSWVGFVGLVGSSWPGIVELHIQVSISMYINLMSVYEYADFTQFRLINCCIDVLHLVHLSFYQACIYD